jgi:hypothetical protein
MASALSVLVCFSDRFFCFIQPRPWTTILLPLPPALLELQAWTTTPSWRWLFFRDVIFCPFLSFSDRSL